MDGGAIDGGYLSCEVTPHDPVLGTARLGSDFRVVDDAALPVSYLMPLALVDLPGDGGPADGGLGAPLVHGLYRTGVHRLGTWPAIQLPDAGNLLFDAARPADAVRQILTTLALPAVGTVIAAGYRTVQSGAFVNGAVAWFDTASPDAGVRWLEAPGIESMLGADGVVLVGSAGLGSPSGVNGVHGVDLSPASPTPTPRLVARYPVIPGEQVRPGSIAVTADGVGVLGYYRDLAADLSLRVVTPVALSAALDGGPAVDLGSAPQLAVGMDLASAAGFGRGVAVLWGSGASPVLPLLDRLEWVELQPADDGGVSASAPRAILTSDDACTSVSQLIPGRDALTVVLYFQGSQRIVRIVRR